MAQFFSVEYLKCPKCGKSHFNEIRSFLLTTDYEKIDQDDPNNIFYQCITCGNLIRKKDK